jgi:hypothetical protein
MNQIAHSAEFDRALLSPGYLADPYRYYAELRESDPIHWSAQTNAWVLTRYQDVRAALVHPQLVSGKRVESYADGLSPELKSGLEPLFYQVGKWIGNMDPPDHKRLRKMVELAFTSRMVEGLRPAIQEIARELLAKASAKGEMDFVEEFAYPLPAVVIAQMLGVPLESRAQFMRWSGALTAYSGTGRPEVGVATAAAGQAAELTAFFSELAEERRRRPREDLISMLVKIEQEGDRLTTRELLSMCGFLIVAGHETTMGLLSNGLLALLRNPEQLRRWQANPELTRSAVEELLRYDSPIQHQTRVASEDIEFGSRRIQKGQRVMPFLGAGNRDPAQFAAPDQLDLGRAPNPHLGFGHGIHHCLGAALARLEAQIALPQVLQTFPGLRLNDPNPPYRRHTSNRNPLRLLITF